jgi:hypothetical protein
MKLTCVPKGDAGPSIEMRFRCTGCRYVVVNERKDRPSVYVHECAFRSTNVISLGTFWPDTPGWCPLKGDSYREMMGKSGELWQTITRKQVKAP